MSSRRIVERRRRRASRASPIIRMEARRFRDSRSPSMPSPPFNTENFRAGFDAVPYRHDDPRFAYLLTSDGSA